MAEAPNPLLARQSAELASDRVWSNAQLVLVLTGLHGLWDAMPVCELSSLEARARGWSACAPVKLVFGCVTSRAN